MKEGKRERGGGGGGGGELTPSSSVSSVGYHRLIGIPSTSSLQLPTEAPTSAPRPLLQLTGSLTGIIPTRRDDPRRPPAVQVVVRARVGRRGGDVLLHVRVAASRDGLVPANVDPGPVRRASRVSVRSGRGPGWGGCAVSSLVLPHIDPSPHPSSIPRVLVANLQSTRRVVPPPRRK